MIHINLLPQEYRRRERTSIKVFSTVMASVVVVCTSLGYFGHVYLNEYKKIESERMQQQEKLDGLQKLAAYDDALVSEAAEYQRRSQTIQKIANSRLLWTKVLDQFVDIVNNNGDTGRHMAWFQNLSTRSDGGRFGGPSLSLQAMIATDQYAKQANFLDDIQAHEEFYQDMAQTTVPGGRVQTTKGKTPDKAISFRLDLAMKAPKDWARNTKK